jgi:endo-alpha-1,4-polygalactosaminidase (GH114 family)
MARKCAYRHSLAMRRFLSALLFITILAAFASAQSAHAAANPLGLYFDESFNNITDYYHSGALLVAGNCNRDDERFAKAREMGAEVIAYFNPIEVYDHLPCQQNAEFYMGDRARVPLWPFPAPGVRVNWPKTHMVDLRAGSEWSNHIVEYISQLMREKKMDGVFLDNIGSRLWDKAKWKEWPKEEQDAWMEGNIDLVRRLDAARKEIDPDFIIVTNGTWDLSNGDKRGFAGEKYVDGVMLEHAKPNAYKFGYAARAFGDGRHRRVLVMANSEEEAKIWADAPGVTHVAYQENYKHPGKPLVPFRKLNDRRRH